MQTRFYNTLTRRVEDFAALEPPHVFMYNCGPTVYDYAHIGNFRAFLFADVLRRFLELLNYKVHQVMNLTDVGHMTEDQTADGAGEDKMQVAIERMKAAKKAGRADVSNPDDPYEVSQYFINVFLDDALQLGLRIAGEYPDRMPRASRHISQMQVMIEELIRNEHAYVAKDGAVYYNVQSFPDYGKLSGNTLEKLRGGAGGRVSEADQAHKRHPADFLLWKPDKSHVMKWPSPWGVGYPGWHIECSAMAMELLGRDVIDIHTGGEDNIFPHHECEIAQACGVSGRKQFARYWLHTRFLLVDGQKMSKSAGNFFTVRQLLDEGVDPAVLRYELIKAHYRSNMNFTRKGLEDSASAVRRLREFYARMKRESGGEKTPIDITHPVLIEFCRSLNDDLNMSGAVASLFKWIAEFEDRAESPAEAVSLMEAFDSVLDVLRPHQQSFDQVDDDVVARCRQIDEARAAKDFPTADRIRAELQAEGYDVQIGKDGAVARKRLV